MASLQVDDALAAIAKLQAEKQLLLTMLTRLHHDVFVHRTRPDDETRDTAFLALMRTMSETRTLIKQLGGQL